MRAFIFAACLGGTSYGSFLRTNQNEFLRKNHNADKETSCAGNKETLIAFQDVDYTKHGVDWEVGTCSSRYLQSPINVDSFPPPRSAESFGYAYQILNRRVPLSWDGNAIFVDLAEPQGAGGSPGELPDGAAGAKKPPLNYLQFVMGAGQTVKNTARYVLSGLKFRIPSEHMYQGNHFPMEMQIVHKKMGEESKQAIISIFFQTAKEPKIPEDGSFPKILDYEMVQDWFPELQKFLDVMPFSKDSFGVLMKTGLDLNQFLIQQKTNTTDNPYLRYYGSSTTPPCTEETVWLLGSMTEPLVVAAEQIAGIQALTENFSTNSGTENGNNRRNMPVGTDRAFAFLQGSKIVPDPNSGSSGGGGPYEMIISGPAPETDDEYRAIQATKTAKKYAQKVVTYVKNVQQRHAKAAQEFKKKLLGK